MIFITINVLGENKDYTITPEEIQTETYTEDIELAQYFQKQLIDDLNEALYEKSKLKDRLNKLEK